MKPTKEMSDTESLLRDIRSLLSETQSVKHRTSSVSQHIIARIDAHLDKPAAVAMEPDAYLDEHGRVVMREGRKWKGDYVGNDRAIPDSWQPLAFVAALRAGRKA